jgi:hypothetical protein
MVSPRPNSRKNYTVQYKQDALSADPDLMLQQASQLPVELMEQLILQDIGGVELISVVRHDQVNGEKVSYTPISNLELLTKEYNPQTVTNPAANFSSLKSAFGIEDDTELYHGSAHSSGAIRLDTRTSNPFVEVEVPSLGVGLLIEVAVSYGYASDVVAAPSSYEYYDGRFSSSVADEFYDGGSSINYFDTKIVAGTSFSDIDYEIDGGRAQNIADGEIDGGDSKGYNTDTLIVGGNASMLPPTIIPSLLPDGKGTVQSPPTLL